MNDSVDWSLQFGFRQNLLCIVDLSVWGVIFDNKAMQDFNLGKKDLFVLIVKLFLYNF